MAWMTYISSWFEQDDWYEGLQRVSDIYVVIIILWVFFSVLFLMQLYCITASFSLWTILHCKSLSQVRFLFDRFKSRGKKMIYANSPNYLYIEEKAFF